MWRAFFLAVGIYACLLGAECLALDKVVLVRKTATKKEGEKPQSKIIKPADWAPWSLMSVGAVVILYSFTIPKRVRD